jgi:hypothetical protein
MMYRLAIVFIFLVGCATEGPEVYSGPIYTKEEGAHCDRCSTIWGEEDLIRCKVHQKEGILMDPYCKFCSYHGAYKYIYADGREFKGTIFNVRIQD